MSIINEKYLKQFSPIPINYTMDEVKNYIDVAELIWLKPVIRDAFLDELRYQVEKNKVSPENSTALLEAIYPYLAYATVYEALPFLWTNISEVGITKGKSDNSESITLKELSFVQEHLRRQVEVRKDNLIKWLDERYKSFPLYHPSNCNCHSCCDRRAKLKMPNPMFTIYGMNKVNTDIK